MAKYVDVFPWQIVAELVRLCARPKPVNPFAISFEYFDSLPLSSALLAEGAAIDFLQKLMISESSYLPYMFEGN